MNPMPLTDASLSDGSMDQSLLLLERPKPRFKFIHPTTDLHDEDFQGRTVESTASAPPEKAPAIQGDLEQKPRMAEELPAEPAEKPIIRISEWLVPTAVLALTATLTGLLLLRMMNFALRRDEQLYVPPASLLTDKTLYADIFYNHVPGSAWLFHALHVVSGSVSALLTGRLVVFGAWIALVALVVLVARITTRSWTVAAFLAVGFLANDYLHGPVGMAASNNFLPLPFAFAGLSLFALAIAHGDRRAGLVFLSGVMLGLAVSMKASAAAFAVPVLVAAFFLPRGRALGERWRSGVTPLVLGGLVGGLPIWIALARDPASFLAHVIGWHSGPHVAYWRQAAEQVPIDLVDRVRLAHSIWFGGANLVLAFATATLAFLAWQNRDRLHEFRAVRGVLYTLVATLALTVALSFVPVPAFPQYFVQPLVVLPLLILFLLRLLPFEVRRGAGAALLAGTVVMLLVSIDGLVRYLPRALDPSAWTVARIHEHGIEIARRVEAASSEGPVATFQPIYPLEGGLPVYEELATGEFAYRSADLATPDLRARMRTTSPSEIQALLEASPPGAVLADPNDELAAPLVAFARANNYALAPDFRIEDRYGVKRLWLRPAP